MPLFHPQEMLCNLEILLLQCFVEILGNKDRNTNWFIVDKDQKTEHEKLIEMLQWAIQQKQVQLDFEPT